MLSHSHLIDQSELHGMVTPKFNKAGMYNLFIKKGTERERNQNILWKIMQYTTYYITECSLLTFYLEFYNIHREIGL